MKKNERPSGMSQLDFLWANYSDFNVSSTVGTNENTILTLKAIKELLKEFKTISSVSIVEENGQIYLLVIDSNDSVLTKLLIPNGTSIIDFGKRKITQLDRNKGCELSLNTEVYYILLNNGNEYLAPIDKYVGAETRSIITSIIENAIYAELKISNRKSIISLSDLEDGLFADLTISDEQSGIALDKTPNGLEAKIVLQNSDKFVKFSLMSIDEYLELSDNNLIDDTTMYFIKGAKFFYFGKTPMGGSEESVVLDNYYTKNLIDKKLENYVTKMELTDYLNWKTYD